MNKITITGLTARPLIYTASTWRETVRAAFASEGVVPAVDVVAGGVCGEVRSGTVVRWGDKNG